MKCLLLSFWREGELHMLPEPFEERYADVLQNIESAIVNIYRQHPNMGDANVDNALSGLIRVYKAEASKARVPTLKLSDVEKLIYEVVKEVCDWRLGRTELRSMPRLTDAAKTDEEIIACLKRIRRSIKLWAGELGRQGYLTYVTEFLEDFPRK
jgi:hypothetical protein